MKSSEKNSDKRLKNLKPWKPGQSGNPLGKLVGTKNKETLRREAIISYAKRNGKTPEEIEKLIEERGINEALKGEYQFYRDYQDRAFGKPVETQKVDMKVNGMLIIPSEVIEKNKLNDIPSSPEHNS